MQAPIAEQHALLQLQAHDSAIDRLEHRRASLPEDARLAELGDALAAVGQLTAEREGTLATVQRSQVRLEHEIDAITAKAEAEEARAVSGRVTSPKELTAIQEEVAGLKRRKATLEDELLELMEQRETLEGELAELTSRRDGFTAEQAQVTKQTAGFLVDQLEKAGYLERVPDPTDGRARLVRVTEKAKGAMPVANPTRP